MIPMPTPWNIDCNRALDIPVSLKENPLAMMHRQDLCHCAFSAGPYYINENLIACENQKRKLTSKIGIYHTVNTITADFFYKTMAEINSTKDKLMIELDKQVNMADMTYEKMEKWKERLIELSGNIITDEQVDLSSPTWTFLENDTDFQNLQKGQVTIEKYLGQMVEQVWECNLDIKRPYTKQKDFEKAMSKVNKWMSIEKAWTFILLALAISGTIAFVCNMFLCKYMKCLKSNQSSMRTELQRRDEEGQNNHGFDLKAVATSLIAMSNLGETQALDINLTLADKKQSNGNACYDWSIRYCIPKSNECWMYNFSVLFA